MQALQPLTPAQHLTRRSRVASQSQRSQPIAQPSVSHPRLQRKAQQKSSPTEPRKQAQSRRGIHRSLAIETTIKLSVNLVLSTVAVSALAHLFPYVNMQRSKLEEVQTAVKSAHDRLQITQLRFNRYFDPYQTKTLMQEQSNRIDPQQQQIVLTEPPAVRPTPRVAQPPAPQVMPEAPRPSGY